LESRLSLHTSYNSAVAKLGDSLEYEAIPKPAPILCDVGED